jgi:hypothetical protein
MSRGQGRIGKVSKSVKFVNSARAIAKKEIKRDKFEKKLLSFLMILTVLSLSILTLFLISQTSLLGYATSIDAQAGSVTEWTIYRKFPTSYWTGIYGLALRVPDFTELLFSDFYYSEIDRQDLFFDCLEPDALGGNEIYATNYSSIDFNSLEPATLSMIDDFTGCSGNVDCPSNTFTQNFSFVVSGRNITSVPGTYTYKHDGDNEIYNLGALWDGTRLVFVTNIQGVQKSYNPSNIVNFQMLLPVPYEGSQEYYFFTDPNDNCPAGMGIGENLVGMVHGYVFNSTGNPIGNVTVIIAGVNVTTDVAGYYNLSFSGIGGDYNMFAYADGFDNYYSNISINYSVYDIQKNFTMQVETPGLLEMIEVGLYGYVRDEESVPIADAQVFFGDSVVYSGLDGYYDISSSVSIGEHALMVVKEGYDNYHQMFNFTVPGLTEHDVVMNLTQIDYDFETGPYTQEPVDPGVQQEIIEEFLARGEDYWISSKEIVRNIRQNTFLEENVAIYNLRRSKMSLTFELSSEVRDFIKIDKVTSTVLPDKSMNLKVTIMGNKPLGIYEGVLTISGDLDQEIPIKIKVVEKKFPIEVLLMGIDLFKNWVQPGENMKYKLNLQNLLRNQNYEVDLVARIKGLNDKKVYYIENFDVEIENSLTLLRSVPVHDNFSNGDYLLEIEANYLDSFSVASSSFVISRPIYMYSFFGVKLWVIFSIISFFSFVALNILMYKRYQARKKRYRIAVEYDTLPTPAERVVKLGKIAETNHPAYYEIDKMTTHGIVAGATGMGKSISAQVLIEECLMKDVCVMVFDPTAQWSGMLRKCDDKKMMSFYSKFGLKPKDARSFKGNVRMIKDFKQKLDINKFLAPGQIQIFSMNKLTPAEIDIFVANTIKQIFRSDPKESPVLKIMLVFDEVHRLLPKFGGSGKGFLQIERACREFRKWGLGVMLISQVLNDFAGQIKANINTEFQARTLEEGDLERIRTKYGEEYLKSLVKAEIGVIMFQNPDYNRGRPYFINFRPILHSTRRLTDEELEQYNKYNDAVDEVEFHIEKLADEKVDIFDLKMELKLIKDKIMSGSFSVVQIYLDGLQPRVLKEWEKLGKKPPAFELEYVDEEAMEEEEAKSKAEKSEENAKVSVGSKKEGELKEEKSEKKRPIAKKRVVKKKVVKKKVVKKK